MNVRQWKALCSALLLVSFVCTNFCGVEANVPVAPAHIAAPSRTSGLVKSRATSVGPASTLFGDPLSESATPANAWLAVGDACLTAGTAATPATSIPACGATAPLDPSGGGALQLTPGTGNSSGMVVYRTPVSTAGGVQISFTDASFNGSTPGADGVTLFLSDASAAIPTVMGNTGGSLGYADGSNNTPNGVVAPGIANGYLGIAFDEFGYFSNPTQGRVRARRSRLRLPVYRWREKCGRRSDESSVRLRHSRCDDSSRERADDYRYLNAGGSAYGRNRPSRRKRYGRLLFADGRRRQRSTGRAG
jgi:hypothetical protein